MSNFGFGTFLGRTTQLGRVKFFLNDSSRPEKKIHGAISLLFFLIRIFRASAYLETLINFLALAFSKL